MQSVKRKTQKGYLPPLCRLVCLWQDRILCSSDLDNAEGGNEDINSEGNYSGQGGWYYGG